METQAKQKFKLTWHYAFVIVFVAFAMYIALVTLLTYTSSLFLTQVAQHFNVGMGTVQLRMTVHSLVVIVMMPLIKPLYNKFNFKLLTVIGLLCYCLAFFGFSVCTSIWQYIALGAVQGVGSALALFIPIPYMTNAWFNKGTALAISIPSVGASLLATFTTPWVQSMISNSGWQYAMRVCCFLGLAVSVPAVLLLAIPTPESKGMRPFGWMAPNAQPSEGTPAKALTVRGVNVKVARRSVILWMFVLIAFIVQVYSTIMRYMSPLLVSYGLTAEQAAYCLSAYTLGTSFSMPLSGIFIDRIGLKRGSIILLGIDVAALLMIMFCGGNQLLCTIGCFLYSFSGLSFIINVGVKQVFGMMDYPAIFSTVTIGQNIAILSVTTLFGFIFDATGSYNALMITTLVSIAIVIAFIFYIFKKKDSLPWEEREAAPAAGKGA